MKSSLTVIYRLIKVKKAIQFDGEPLIVGKIKESCGFAIKIHNVVHREMQLKLR